MPIPWPVTLSPSLSSADVIVYEFHLLSKAVLTLSSLTKSKRPFHGNPRGPFYPGCKPPALITDIHNVLQ